MKRIFALKTLIQSNIDLECLEFTIYFIQLVIIMWISSFEYQSIVKEKYFWHEYLLFKKIDEFIYYDIMSCNINRYDIIQSVVLYYEVGINNGKDIAQSCLYTPMSIYK